MYCEGVRCLRVIIQHTGEPNNTTVCINAEWKICLRYRQAVKQDRYNFLVDSKPLTGGDTREYVMRPLDPESASVAVAVKISVPVGCD